MINTPPQDRLPIKTMIAETDSSMMEHALLRELSRDGQVFFIHNRIESLPRMAASLQKMVPSAKIVMGHGRMDPEEIDAVFEAFKQGQADILLSTTIVENGIDIPNANTIFIDRADQFGLSDLYQLRGRVGRWNRTAYAYFLVPKERTLPEVARKRLQALVESSGYGGGVKIAMRDLEIRGAGDILGVQQSGQISAVGFHLYCKLLKKAIEACKEERPLQVVETKMDFSLEARIPEDYVEEPSLRMELYYRLGSASKPEEIQEILEEMKDRFGPVPTAVLWLGLFSRIRIYASFLEISAMKFGKMTLSIEKQVEGKGSAKITFPLPPMKNFQVFEERVKELLSSWKPVYQKEST